MQLTQKTEYALRILIYLSLQEKEKRSNITEIAECFSLSRNHLVKIVHKLGKLNYIRTVRGKGGGIQLIRNTKEIFIGDVVRKMEENLEIVNCEKPACPIMSICKLKIILNQARDAFIKTLDLYTLADITQEPQLLVHLLRNNTEQN